MKLLFLLALLVLSIVTSSASMMWRRDKIFAPELPGRTNRIEVPSRQARSATFDPRDLKTPPRVINRRGKFVRRTSP